MNIAISNIAWNKTMDTDVRSLLTKSSIRFIEIAPGKIWGNPVSAPDTEILDYRKFWESEGISIISMQSLIFGRQEQQIFQTKKQLIALYDYISEIMELGAKLGVKSFVFGSPKNRVVPSSLSKQKADYIAGKFLYRLSKQAKSFSAVICIEANPKEYGTNFLTTTNEAINFIIKQNNPSVRLQLDTGTMILNNEPYEAIIDKAVSLTNHFHISEPYLSPVPQKTYKHKLIARALKKSGYDNIASIEMREPEKGFALENIDKAIKFVKQTYI